MEQDVVCNMGTEISPRRTVQFMSPEFITDRKGSKGRGIVHAGRAKECFYRDIAFVNGYNICCPVYFYDPASGKSPLGINTAGSKCVSLSADCLSSGCHGSRFWIHVIKVSVMNQPSGFHGARAFEEIPLTFYLSPSGSHYSFGIHVISVAVAVLPPGQEYASGIKQVALSADTLEFNQARAF